MGRTFKRYDTICGYEAVVEVETGNRVVSMEKKSELAGGGRTMMPIILSKVVGTVNGEIVSETECSNERLELTIKVVTNEVATICQYRGQQWEQKTAEALIVDGFVELDKAGNEIPTMMQPAKEDTSIRDSLMKP